MNPMVAKLSASAALVAASTLGAAAENWKSSFTLHGDAGLIDMPTAYGLRDGALAATLSFSKPHTRMNLAFQITPRLTGVLRYDLESNATGPGTASEIARGIDLRYRLLNETAYLPAIAIGARNLAGDLQDSGEYIVASKSFGDRLQVTGGLGWGRYATHGGFASPFGGQMATRPTTPMGALGISPIFQGDAAAFAGIEYTLTPELRIKAEYSSDSYAREATNAGLAARSPFNFGVTYSPSQRFQLGAYSLGGKDFGLTGTLIIDPNSSYALAGADPAPVPVAIVTPDPAAAASWGSTDDAQLSPALAVAMANDGLRLVGVETRGNVMRVRYENTQYRAEAQGMGRLSRILTQIAPAGVTEFQLEPVSSGIAKSQLVVRRADIVELENELGAAQTLFDRVDIRAAGPRDGLTLAPRSEPRFGWSIAPYLTFAQVGANNRFQYQMGLKASMRYAITPSLTLSGAVQQRLTGNEAAAAITNPAPGATSVPVVRRDIGDYMLGKGPQLEHLTLTHLGRAAPDVYTKFTAGYLERMYGGASAEVLWKPADSRLGFGAELTYASKRDPQGLGFQGYNTVTGFLSAYYEFPNDFVGRIDAGRYLAGDWGTTVSLAREFPNGWKVGGYVTMTDVSATDFGPGGYDKGLVVEIPINWLVGSPTRETRPVRIDSRTADGGQRVQTGQELYSLVRDSHAKDLSDSWGRFWK